MRIALLSVLVTGMLTSTAAAHIHMLAPTPRYPKEVAMDNKACPCGVGESSRLCNVEGDRSDPNRAAEARVTTLNTGGTVTVRFDEYIAHSGRYRVAIDFDGADLEDFSANPLIDIADPSGNTGGGSIWQIEVPLPDINCDNCTLQLIQMMDGNTTDPVADPMNRSTYFSCADIKLVGADTSVPDGGVVPGGPDAGGTADPTAPDASGSTGDPQNPASGSGCQSGGSSTVLGLLWVAAALLYLRRRRLSSQRS
ncbi:MAG: lytic polysaccharide monooxygenase [Myxococcales bacterium]|nr:lytic polysaccharide monooxygenase [Myxococcales bacterium]